VALKLLPGMGRQVHRPSVGRKIEAFCCCEHTVMPAGVGPVHKEGRDRSPKNRSINPFPPHGRKSWKGTLSAR